MKKVKIEIKNRWTGKVLFDYSCENNTIKKTVQEANLRGADLWGADLQEADLQEANLLGANLRGANLLEANLRGADLWGADLQEANLRGADLWGADLRGANLRGANLLGANLLGADLQEAYLQEANLRGADLWGANLRGANIDQSTIKHKFSIVPDEGQFIGFKKLKNQAIAKIQIPSKAKRTSNFINRKCRAEYVKVLKIWDKEGNEIKKEIGSHDGKTVYEVGKITKPDSYNDDMRLDCTNGIHFFITKQEAKEY